MNIEVQRLRDVAMLARLAREATAQGFSFVERLVREWNAGVNRFDAGGEALFGACSDGALVGCGGINRDPYVDDPARSNLGRVRHVYVLDAHRRSGVGRALMSRILEHAAGEFTSVRLKTETREAVLFYESLGFVARPITGGFELARSL